MATRGVLSAALVVALGAGMACSPATEPPDLEDGLRTFVADAIATAGFDGGVAVHVDAPSLHLAWEQAWGPADPATGEAMTPAHPVRIASNTKTYVAVAVLRLWEQGRVDLDAPITEVLPADMLAILDSDGYRTGEITVRHLLTHTSGLYDHGGAESYGAAILARPQHRWSRLEQVQLCADEGDPLAEPGAVYNYSDTGYVLLGQILEDVTGADLAGAVWSVVDRRRLGLNSTWFESLEPRPAGARARAHQLFGDVDVTDFDPSFDLWGGGGIAATVGDMARFMRALFAGEVFDDPGTLDTMLTTFDGVQAAPGASDRALPPGAYRMGVWVLPHDGVTLHRHTGFWCTSATWVPELDLVVSVTVNQHQAGPLLYTLQDGLVDVVKDRA